MKEGKYPGRRTKGWANDNTRPWNGKEEDWGLISLLLQYLFLPWPFLFFYTVSTLFCPLSLSPSLSLVLSAPYYAKYLLSFMWSSRLEMIRNIKPLKEREGEGGERDRARARDWFLYLEERMLLLLMNIIRGGGHQKLCFSSVSHRCAYILVYTHTARHISKMVHAESLAVKCSVGRALACGV